MNRIPSSIAAILSASLLLIAQNLLAQQQSAEFDMLASPPERVVVEEVDPELGVVVINGQEFEIYEGDTSLFGIPPEAAQRGITIDRLTAGSEVMVMTDGTESTADRRAKIIAIWRPF